MKKLAFALVVFAITGCSSTYSSISNEERAGLNAGKEIVEPTRDASYYEALERQRQAVESNRAERERERAKKRAVGEALSHMGDGLKNTKTCNSRPDGFGGFITTCN